MDLCLVGVEYALAEWVKRHTTIPTVLWVSASYLGLAEHVICLAPARSNVRRLTPIADPSYSANWWSVGSYLHRGFGSVGA